MWIRVLLGVLVIVVVWEVLVSHWVMFLLFGVVVFYLGWRAQDLYNDYLILVSDEEHVDMHHK